MKWKLMIRNMVSFCVLAELSLGLCLGSLTFIRGEVELFDSPYESLTQSALNVHFDQNNRLHGVFSDDRDGFQHIFGATMLRNGYTTPNFHAYVPPVNTDLFDYGQVMSLPGYPNEMFMLGIDETSPILAAVVSSWDLTNLPDVPTVTNLNSTTIAATVMGYLDTVSSGDYLFYVYNFNGMLYLNRFDVSSNSWDISETILSTINEEMTSPRLVVDDDGYLYLGYQQYNGISGFYQFVVRRSVNPQELTSGFLMEHYISPTPKTSIFEHIDLAVTGDFATGNLKVATVYQDPFTPAIDVVASVEHNGDWTEPTWIGTDTVINGGLGTTTALRGPDIQFGVNKIFLRAVWLDDRTGNDHLFGTISFTGGLTWRPNKQLSNGTPVIEGVPQIVKGFAPGNLAIAYNRNTGIGISPHALVIMALFYDACDDDPAIYWDTSVGIVPVNTQFHGLLGKSYELANGSERGQLIRDFGSQEQMGSVDMYFYDDIGNTTEDFFIGLEDNSGRGVIRMLGVRNETTQSKYSYYDGVQWVDWGVPVARSTGWHHVVMTVDETGMEMFLEYLDGEVATWSDPTYTGFTSVFIQGGSDSEPYYVDDVQVEVIPLESGDEVPTTSFLALTLLLIGFAVLIRRSI
ncbi:LamG domain-containing protein [bacterium]|nr:LamG domain-containing protein [bacterium]